jgi:hypothetical protein
MAYSLRQASRIVGLAPATVAALARAGVIAVSPAGAARQGDLLFTFADLATLRAVATLPATAVRRSLRAGRSALLHASTGRRLRALGARLVVVEPDGRLWDAETGQWLLGFDEESAPVARVVVSAAWNQSAPSAPVIDPFERALLLEATDPDAAAAGYRACCTTNRSAKTPISTWACYCTMPVACGKRSPSIARAWRTCRRRRCCTSITASPCRHSARMDKREKATRRRCRSIRYSPMRTITSPCAASRPGMRRQRPATPIRRGGCGRSLDVAPRHPGRRFAARAGIGPGGQVNW